jgi:hypothetical protein
MRKVTVSGRAIQNLVGLREDLLSKGFQVEGFVLDNNAVCICLADGDLKDPTAAVQAFTDTPTQGSAVTLTAPNGYKWVVRVANDGSLTTSKLT